MTVTTYGPHMMGDLDGCSPKRMKDGEFIYRFMQDLVTVIGLTPIGSPHLDLYTGSHTEWEGFSATVHIQTSHITAHFFAFGYVFIDIFSCKPFDQARTRRYIEDKLGPANTEWWYLGRGRNFPANLIDPEQRSRADV